MKTEKLKSEKLKSEMPAVPDLLTTEELCERLKVCKKTIYEKTKAGEIPVEIDLPGIRRYVLGDVVAALKTLSPAPVCRGPARRPEGVSEILAELTAQRKAARAAKRAAKKEPALRSFSEEGGAR